MSPSPEHGTRRERADGFTLIEVIVAMAIFLLVAGAAAPVLVGGLRAAATARDVTQAKAVAQGQVEKMRDLPFYVGRAAGDYLDVLDTYYRCGPSSISSTPAPDCTQNTPPVTPSCASTTLTALPPTSWTGYVSDTATHCSWEPAGPLYRVSVPVSAPGLGAFSMVVSTQFLAGNGTPSPVAPRTNYSSQKVGQDGPPASQIGVTVAVFYKTASGVRYSVTYTQIEQGNPAAPRITSQAKASTVRLASALDADTNLLAQVGVINLTGELYTGSRVVTTASAATAGDSLGQQINGARLNLVAPVDQPATSASVGNVAFPVSGCTYQCFGDTVVDQASAISTNGLPRAGTPTAPVRALIPHATDNDGFRFSNGAGDPRLDLKGSEPMVSLDTTTPVSMRPVSGCVVQPSGATAAYLAGTGYLDATSTSVAACGTAQSTIVRLFPTTFADKGVIRIELDGATASCATSKTTGGAASAGYTATVSYWDGSSYVTLPTLSSTNATDPLAAVDLTATVGERHTLGDYIASWRSTTSSQVRTSVTTTSAEASIPSAVSITTTPTRAADPTSIVSLDLGAVSCQVGDTR